MSERKQEGAIGHRSGNIKGAYSKGKPTGGPIPALSSDQTSAVLLVQVFPLPFLEADLRNQPDADQYNDQWGQVDPGLCAGKGNRGDHTPRGCQYRIGQPHQYTHERGGWVRMEPGQHGADGDQEEVELEELEENHLLTSDRHWV